MVENRSRFNGQTDSPIFLLHFCPVSRTMTTEMASSEQATPRASAAESYLGYLDKEMNIMGILSVFCVLTVAGVASAFKDAKINGDTVASVFWTHGSIYFVCGCFCVLFAGLFFYRQRSLLAWYYGQICLSEITGQNGPLDEWLSAADGWTTWRWYQAAFATLVAGFAEFSLGVLAMKFDWISTSRVPVALPILAAACFSTTMWLVFGAYQSEEDPWQTLFSKLGIKIG
jgi:hypothetical protein